MPQCLHPVPDPLPCGNHSGMRTISQSLPWSLYACPGLRQFHQYIKNMEIHNSTLKTKDAFWHTNNVTVTDTTLEGEYLAWYSENLTLIRCHIKGTQPLCYCKNLKLIDCTMENTDLAFENSEVYANIIGNVMSIKNPKSGEITVDSVNEIIRDDEKYQGKIIIK